MKVNKAMSLAKQKAEQNNFKLRTIDAKILMIYVLKISNVEFVVTRRDIDLNKKQQEQYFKYIDELIAGKPLQYITNERHFMSHKFYVNENVLIPQPDTEILVWKVIDIVEKRQCQSKIKVLDLCTGSGAIAISLKSRLKEKVDVVATDISKKALEVAKINAKNILNDVNEIEFIQSDMFENVKGKFDIIVSNPPYIETETIQNLPPDVQNEPRIALDGGEDGLKFYRIIKDNVPQYLEQGGYAIMEIGYNQRNELLKLFPGAECIKDFADNDRVVIYRL